MTIRMRDFQWHEDFGRVMEFLSEIIVSTQTLRTWIPNRFENRKYGPCGPDYLDEEDTLVKIWEDTENLDSSNKPRIVAVAVFSDGFAGVRSRGAAASRSRRPRDAYS